MRSRLPMHQSPRCGAYSRRTGEACRNGAMPNGRCRMHGGKTPTGELHGAFIDGEFTSEAVAERREAAKLRDTATALLLAAIHAQTDISLKLHKRLLRPEEAEAQLEASRAQFDAARATRRQAFALKYAWLDRYRRRAERGD